MICVGLDIRATGHRISQRQSHLQVTVAHEVAVSLHGGHLESAPEANSHCYKTLSRPFLDMGGIKTVLHWRKVTLQCIGI